ncbi:MAG: Ribosomal RNA small subunit methyltransferase I [Candidatus Moranbacteria bacterium GW2011_GWE1_35_17]|nr:MAG: Ribosomal RNA small subunit methyltransferase I [Candidatus Moranbacteria bacterium GW2011_GWE1_35_17]KKP72743.1 MAG: Ribosomal RNA small subunit methyltransferase I [Candidatus Moranbacteria bacterium GW2011_GWE2_35_164]KKP85203.1 MAG: Ribosomal RNA small subunit methyltransferase I [Candidatus Moranbacteria bacterium GW2011_GWF2_35_54]
MENLEKGILYVVATPIGNMGDITLRAIETLKTVNLILCEDTRVTRKLLDRYEIKVSAMSYHQHSKIAKVDEIIERLKNGENMALVTDAGTPGISDPGNMLVEQVVGEEISVVPIPGASAIGALISVAGIDMQKFVFLGFPPHKKGRQTFFKEAIEFKYPVMYYDSPHRLLKNLELLKELGYAKDIIVGRELTKMFEEVVRGSIDEMTEYFSRKEKIKGELVVILS